MRVFLGLGDAELRQAGLRHHLAQHVGQLLAAGTARSGTRSARSSTRSCRRRRRSGRRCARSKPLKAGSSSAVRISRARSARKLTMSTPSPSFMPVIAADHGRQDELVAGLRRIGADRSRRSASARFAALRRRPSRDRPLHPVPALVAVHGVVAAARRARSATPGSAGDVLQERRDMLAGARGGASRPSRKPWMTTGTPGGDERLRQGGEMGLMGMHAAGRQQAQQMAAPPDCFSVAMKPFSAGLWPSSPSANRLVDARQVLHHDPAGAEIHVPDFGIAHLAVRQADIQLRGVQEGVRAGRPETIENRACWPGPRRCRPGPRDSPSHRERRERRDGDVYYRSWRP